jgi:hypothetical protein
MDSIVTPLMTSMREQLRSIEKKFIAQPEAEMKHLLLLALEREEIVAVGYRDSLVQHRLSRMPISDDIRDIIRHAMIWVWQDEEMHVVYARGVIAQLKNRLLSLKAVVRETQGIIGGWGSSLEQHVSFREAPIARSLSTILMLLGKLSGAVPKEVRDYIQLRPFREYCLFNVAAEMTAALVYDRMIHLAEKLGLPENSINTLIKVREDEVRHERIFTIFSECLTTKDELSPEWSIEKLIEKIGEIDPAYLSRFAREQLTQSNHLVGSGGRVIVRSGSILSDKISVFKSALDASDLTEQIHQSSRALGKTIADLKVVIKPTFMMSYSHKDPSPAIDPELLHSLTGYLKTLGVASITIIESPKVYETFFKNREVISVAEEFGFAGHHCTIEDCSKNLIQYQFPRGLGGTAVSKTWGEADFRINFSKMRSHPIERALLTLGNTEGLGHHWTDFLFVEREASYQTAILMIHDQFPAQFTILDGYAHCPDGPLGVMGSTNPKHPMRIYAGRDPLSIDLTAARHMGLSNPLESPLLRSAVYWFGDPRERLTIDGCDSEISEWKGPCHNDFTALFSLAAQITYQRCSGRGAVFVPEMDPKLYPPIEPSSLPVTIGRKIIQRVFGLHHR